MWFRNKWLAPLIPHYFQTFRFLRKALKLEPNKDGDMQLIHHLSYRENSSINDYIDHSACSVQYFNIDQVADMILLVGTGAFLAKCWHQIGLSISSCITGWFWSARV